MGVRIRSCNWHELTGKVDYMVTSTSRIHRFHTKIKTKQEKTKEKKLQEGPAATPAPPGLGDILILNQCRKFLEGQLVVVSDLLGSLGFIIKKNKLQITPAQELRVFRPFD